MMCDGNDLNGFILVTINDAERKLVEEESAVSPVHPRPTSRCISDAGDRRVEFGEKGIRGRRAALKIPSTRPLSLVRG